MAARKAVEALLVVSQQFGTGRSAACWRDVLPQRYYCYWGSKFSAWGEPRHGAAVLRLLSTLQADSSSTSTAKPGATYANLAELVRATEQNPPANHNLSVYGSCFTLHSRHLTDAGAAWSDLERQSLLWPPSERDALEAGLVNVLAQLPHTELSQEYKIPSAVLHTVLRMLQTGRVAHAPQLPKAINRIMAQTGMNSNTHAWATIRDIVSYIAPHATRFTPSEAALALQLLAKRHPNATEPFQALTAHLAASRACDTLPTLPADSVDNGRVKLGTTYASLDELLLATRQTPPADHNLTVYGSCFPLHARHLTNAGAAWSDLERQSLLWPPSERDALEAGLVNVLAQLAQKYHIPFTVLHTVLRMLQTGRVAHAPQLPKAINRIMGKIDRNSNTHAWATIRDIVSYIAPHAALFPASEAALALQLLAKRHPDATEPFQALTAHLAASRACDTLPMSKVVLMAWSCVTVGLTPQPLVQQIFQALQERVSELNERDLPISFWCVSRLGQPQPHLISALQQAASKQRHAFGGPSMALLAWSAAHMYDAALQPLIRDIGRSAAAVRAAAQSDRVSTEQLSSILYAAAVYRCIEPGLSDVVLARLTNISPRDLQLLSPGHKVRLLWALSHSDQLLPGHPATRRLAACIELHAQRQALTLHEVGMVLEACVRLKHRDPGFTSALIQCVAPGRALRDDLRLVNKARVYHSGGQTQRGGLRMTDGCSHAVSNSSSHQEGSLALLCNHRQMQGQHGSTAHSYSQEWNPTLALPQDRQGSNHDRIHSCSPAWKPGPQISRQDSQALGYGSSPNTLIQTSVNALHHQHHSGMQSHKGGSGFSQAWWGQAHILNNHSMVDDADSLFGPIYSGNAKRDILTVTQLLRSLAALGHSEDMQSVEALLLHTLRSLPLRSPVSITRLAHLVHAAALHPTMTPTVWCELFLALQRAATQQGEHWGSGEVVVCLKGVATRLAICSMGAPSQHLAVQALLHVARQRLAGMSAKEVLDVSCAVTSLLHVPPRVQEELIERVVKHAEAYSFPPGALATLLLSWIRLAGVPPGLAQALSVLLPRIEPTAAVQLAWCCVHALDMNHAPAALAVIVQHCNRLVRSHTLQPSERGARRLHMATGSSSDDFESGMDTQASGKEIRTAADNPLAVLMPGGMASGAQGHLSASAIAQLACVAVRCMGRVPGSADLVAGLHDMLSALHDEEINSHALLADVIGLARAVSPDERRAQRVRLCASR